MKHKCELMKLNFQETLTGFKWMGNKTVDLMKDGKTVLFAFEEAIGKIAKIVISIGDRKLIWSD